MIGQPQPEIESRKIEGKDNSKLSTNWMEKLKPSSKNKVVQDRVKRSSTVGDSNFTERDNDLSKFGIECKSSRTEKNDSQPSMNESSMFQQKWNDCVIQSKYQNLKIDTKDKFDVENSIISFEDINNIIEEKYKMAINDNIFLRQEFHSILPFLLIQNKEIHRMTLSDYEIKMICKSNKDKSRSRTEANDYYKVGLINFYKGKYSIAYSNFKSAHKLKENDVNIAKWFCFSSLIMIFCDPAANKINFTYMRNINSNDDKNNKEDSKEGDEDGFTFFPCCSNRRNNSTNIRNIQSNSIIELEKESILNISAIANEVSNALNLILPKISPTQNINGTYIPTTTSINNSYQINNSIEILWLQMIISTFCQIHPNQKLFGNTNTNIIMNDPKLYIKKIKDIDDYLAYIAYGEHHYLIDDKYSYDKVLRQLIHKYPNKVEAFLRYWQLLTEKNGKFKNYDLAHSISEVYWKNSSTIHFDEVYSVYGLYILIAHAKSSFLIGNHFYSITYFQKEYPSNFMYPSLFYLVSDLYIKLIINY
jgi:hypothetical protein